MASDDLTEEDLYDILTTSREYNKGNSITGCLLCHNKEFLQILEGDKEVIEDLFHKIENDHRNTHVTLIDFREAKERMYPDWYMAYHEFKNQDLKDYQDVLDLDQFQKFHELIYKPEHSQKLFYLIAKDIIK